MKRACALLIGAGLVLAACDAGDVEANRAKIAPEFPAADRPVAGLGSNQFSTEVQRDSKGEAQTVMDLAAIAPGMSVADIGAGNGYYTIRLADRVGPEGRVLAEDIDHDALARLGKRVERERLDNVAIKPGDPTNPNLPDNSFDRIFLVHMYHEVAEPYAFLWNLWPALREGGKVVVVDVDRPTQNHGIDPSLLACEFRQVGYVLDSFQDSPQISGYYAQFRRDKTRPAPEDIQACARAAVHNTEPRS